MLEIIALIKPVQLNESSVNDAMDTPAFNLQRNVMQDLWYLISILMINIEFQVMQTIQIDRRMKLMMSGYDFASQMERKIISIRWDNIADIKERAYQEQQAKEIAIELWVFAVPI